MRWIQKDDKSENGDGHNSGLRIKVLVGFTVYVICLLGIDFNQFLQSDDTGSINKLTELLFMSIPTKGGAGGARGGGGQVPPDLPKNSFNIGV